MTGPTADHPALDLLADTLRATSEPAAPEDIAKLLAHALDATGYELAPKGTLQLIADLAAEPFMATPDVTKRAKALLATRERGV